MAVLSLEQANRFTSLDFQAVHTDFLGEIYPTLTEGRFTGSVQVTPAGLDVVIDYEARFSKSSHHAAIILSTDAERARRFIVGLHYGIRVSKA